MKIIARPKLICVKCRQEINTIIPFDSVEEKWECPTHGKVSEVAIDRRLSTHGKTIALIVAVLFLVYLFN